MTTLNAVQLVEEYVGWLRRSILVAETDSYAEITTPFMNRHNDYVQIYLVAENDHFVLTDGGDTLADLEMSGVDLNTPKRRSILETILRGFGIERSGDQLRVSAKRADLPRRHHALLQAMLAVNDMFVMGQEHVLSLFLEDVEGFLNQHRVRYVPRVKLTGRSGFDHNFDYVVPASDKRPERLLRAINSPKRDSIGALCFAWNDTRDVRAPDAQAYAVLNDQEQLVSADNIQALKSYQITPMLWSQRETLVSELVD